MIKKQNDEYFVNKMSEFGRVMWGSHAIEIFRDGDGSSFIYNKWHPFSYILMAVSIIVVFALEGAGGVSEEWKYNKFCWDFTDYWKKPENKIVYVSR